MIPSWKWLVQRSNNKKKSSSSLSSSSWLTLLLASRLNFGTVSLRIWENSQSMLLRNKHTIYYYLIFKDGIVMLIQTPLLMKLKKDHLNPTYLLIYIRNLFVLIFVYNLFFLDVVNVFYLFIIIFLLLNVCKCISSCI